MKIFILGFSLMLCSCQSARLIGKTWGENKGGFVEYRYQPYMFEDSYMTQSLYDAGQIARKFCGGEFVMNSEGVEGLPAGSTYNSRDGFVFWGSSEKVIMSFTCKKPGPAVYTTRPEG